MECSTPFDLQECCKQCYFTQICCCTAARHQRNIKIQANYKAATNNRTTCYCRTLQYHNTSACLQILVAGRSFHADSWHKDYSRLLACMIHLVLGAAGSFISYAHSSPEQECTVLDQEPDHPLVPFLGSNVERSP